LIECFVHVDAATKNSPDSGYPGDGSGLNGELPHNGLDNGFYENLPFHGMKPQQPHKQAFRVEDDDLIYADSDYRDLYAYGPVTYTQTSREAAQTKKDELAKRYGTIGR